MSVTLTYQAIELEGKDGKSVYALFTIFAITYEFDLMFIFRVVLQAVLTMQLHATCVVGCIMCSI